MAAKTWDGGGANENWSTGGNWDLDTVPATTDSVTFDGTSTKNCTIDSLGTWSGGTFTVTSAYTGVITKSVAMTTAAFAINASGTATFTDSSGASMTVTSLTISSGTFTATSGTLNVTGGITVPATATFNGNGGTIALNGTGTQTINMSASLGGTGPNLFTVNKTAGALTFQNRSYSFGANPSTNVGTGSISFSTGSTGSATGTWSNTGAFTLAGTGILSGVTSLNVTEGSITIQGATTIPSNLNVTMTITSATARTFAGVGKTYGNFYRTGAGGGTLTITGSNTFAEFKDNDGSVAHSILFTAGTTQTVSSFVVDGSSGKLVTIGSPTAATHTLTTTGGAVSCTYLSISFSVVDASPTWTADVNSTDGGNNTNWIFAGAPTGHPTVKRVAGVPFAQHRVVGKSPLRMWKHRTTDRRVKRMVA